MATAAHTTSTPSRRGLLTAATAALTMAAAAPLLAQTPDLLAIVREHNRQVDQLNAATDDVPHEALERWHDAIFALEDRCWATPCQSRSDCLAKMELLAHQLSDGITYPDAFLIVQIKDVALALAEAQ